ncbi:hypothetical protein IWQ47_001588 [Aquimarina sp. EL_43]|uniref:hypothetical protein n=1 Tax=unclassified Aquimarina TaxID=2627091 RepID=UPI0018CB1F57|nr:MULTISPECIES: hypothetical protein [unclassified Aquimarina]MBG6130329.1 hypothetical protein [Aquimarina sp. EL_35]MBG6149109.1 hypothetical protein [Aquimarina sp. EL_32]MBG6168517.1 hypothetical protein [Aquimarina sp. EL_43]
MKTTRLICILFLMSFISCKNEVTDKTFKIFHLKPDRIYIDTAAVNGKFSKRRNDFFVVKNYDINNEHHKIKIDSFVVNHVKKDSFLIQNKNASWRLTFFKYGDGIDEYTQHEYSTDYTIHDLFSYKKEIGSVYFDTREGYRGSNYTITPDKHTSSHRKIIDDYFNTNSTLQYNIKQEQKARGSFNPYTHKQDTIKVIAKFIKRVGGSKIQIVQYKFLEPITKLITLEEDTLNIAYSIVYEPKEFPEKSMLTLVKDSANVGLKNYYIFPDYNPEKGIEPVNE